MSTTTTIVEKVKEADTPFLTGARKSGSSVEFWKSYVEARPEPPQDFFELIYKYHQRYDIPMSPVQFPRRIAGVG
jgi:hypothetical protein